MDCYSWIWNVYRACIIIRMVHPNTITIDDNVLLTFYCYLLALPNHSLKPTPKSTFLVSDDHNFVNTK